MEVFLRNHLSFIPGISHNNRIQETANPNHISKSNTPLNTKILYINILQKKIMSWNLL